MSVKLLTVLVLTVSIPGTQDITASYGVMTNDLLKMVRCRLIPLESLLSSLKKMSEEMIGKQRLCKLTTVCRKEVIRVLRKERYLWTEIVRKDLEGKREDSASTHARQIII